GQICLCGSRIFVEKSIAAKFVEALVEVTKTVISTCFNFYIEFLEFKTITHTKMYCSSIGDPKTSKTGSLISLDHRSKVESYVELALKEGGKIVLGGHRPKDLKPPFDKGAFYVPTIITGLPFDSHIYMKIYIYAYIYICIYVFFLIKILKNNIQWFGCQFHTLLLRRCATEEIFGPVVTVHEFQTENEVIDMCNSVKYGLAGSVWTNHLKRGHRVAQAIESGMIWVNCWMKRDLRVPFGGVKESGVGREGGQYSMDFWTHQKN
ncbi:5-carboxymethyl-2-hydroxymuconate semialdehyde dehydrogenase, partial [Reticulomyxa filosa]